MPKPGVHTSKSMATTEARQSLPALVQAMRTKVAASADVLDDAITIGPHRKGGAVLLPEVDILAHAAETAALRERVEQLEEDLEDAGTVLFLQERLAVTSGARLGASEFLQAIGMEDHVEKLPRS